jgi:hypothetical protein
VASVTGCSVLGGIPAAAAAAPGGAARGGGASRRLQPCSGRGARRRGCSGGGGSGDGLAFLAHCVPSRTAPSGYWALGHRAADFLAAAAAAGGGCRRVYRRKGYAGSRAWPACACGLGGAAAAWHGRAGGGIRGGIRRCAGRSLAPGRRVAGVDTRWPEFAPATQDEVGPGPRRSGRQFSWSWCRAVANHVEEACSTWPLNKRSLHGTARVDPVGSRTARPRHEDSGY